jgi:hypothetical protein
MVIFLQITKKEANVIYPLEEFSGECSEPMMVCLHPAKSSILENQGSIVLNEANRTTTPFAHVRASEPVEANARTG